MGTEYGLLKVSNLTTYDLGKPAMREPQAGWESRIKGVTMLNDPGKWLAVMQPSESAMWRIGTDDGTYGIVVLSERLTASELADLINTACFQTDDRERAMRIAEDILAWAGTERVILFSDDAEGEIKKRFRLGARAFRRDRSIYDVLRESTT